MSCRLSEWVENCGITVAKAFTYTAKDGDTFASVSRATTGSDTRAAGIRAANPGLSEPFTAGTRITIPRLGSGSRTKFKSDGIDIRIGGYKITPYDRFSLSMSADGFRSISFDQPNEILTRTYFPPLSPLGVECAIDGKLVMTGYLEPVTFSDSRDKSSMTISCVSDANLLNNKASASAWPIAPINADLYAIADKICPLFSLDFAFNVDPGPVFKKAAMQRDDNALDFLASLAQQRGYVITDDENGFVVFTDAVATGAPMFTVDAEKRPDVAISVSYKMDNYYSSITGVLTGKTGRKQKTFTVQNPHFSGIIRDHQVTFSDIDKGELETATRGAMGRMFADAFSVSITVPFWHDKNGDLIVPNRLVYIRDPRHYIDDYTLLEVRHVELINDGRQKIAVLECTLPGVFSGVIPDSVPWRS